MTRKGGRRTERKRWKDMSGRINTLPPADVLCAVFDALRHGETPAQLRTRYPITERTLYRYRRAGSEWRPLLRARWWVENRERARRMLARGRNCNDLFVRLKPPAELFPARASLYDFLRGEEIREIEFRSIKS